MKSLLILFLVFGVFTFGNAQSILRQSIGSMGTTYQSKSLTLQSATGQPYKTGTYHQEGYGHSPGFIQSSLFKLAYPNDSQPLVPIRIHVYPNPATETVSFISDEELTDLTLKVYDLKGTVIHEDRVDQLGAYTLNCMNWSNGMYLIFLSESTGQIYQSRLIKTN